MLPLAARAVLGVLVGSVVGSLTATVRVRSRLPECFAMEALAMGAPAEIQGEMGAKRVHASDPPGIRANPPSRDVI